MQKTSLTTFPSFLVMCTCWSGLVCKSCFTYMALISGTQQPFSCARPLSHGEDKQTNNRVIQVQACCWEGSLWQNHLRIWWRYLVPRMLVRRVWRIKAFYCNTHFDLHNVILWWFIHWPWVGNDKSGEFGDIVDLGQKHCRMMCVLDACLAQRGVGHPVHVGPIKILHS